MPGLTLVAWAVPGLTLSRLPTACTIRPCLWLGASSTTQLCTILRGLLLRGLLGRPPSALLTCRRLNTVLLRANPNPKPHLPAWAPQVAWRTACELWPWLTEECRLTERVMDESAYVDRRRLGGQPLCGTAEDAMPLWLRAKMRLLRPVMRADADALLLVRLCMAEVIGDGGGGDGGGGDSGGGDGDSGGGGDPRKRPLTVGEICGNWDEALRETLQACMCVLGGRMVAIWVAHQTLLGVISQPTPTPFTPPLPYP